MTAELGGQYLPRAVRPAPARGLARRRLALRRREHRGLPAARRRGGRDADHREPLQGQLLAVSRVRPEDGRLLRPGRRASTRRTSASTTIPSNTILAGEDPLELLRRVKHRVVTMHASDRYLAEGTIEDLRREEDSVGYAKRLRHGEIGKGMNDYDAIFAHAGRRRLRRLDQHRGRRRRHGPTARKRGVPAAQDRPALARVRSLANPCRPTMERFARSVSGLQGLAPLAGSGSETLRPPDGNNYTDTWEWSVRDFFQRRHSSRFCAGAFVKLPLRLSVWGLPCSSAPRRCCTALGCLRHLGLRRLAYGRAGESLSSGQRRDRSRRNRQQERRAARELRRQDGVRRPGHVAGRAGRIGRPSVAGRNEVRPAKGRCGRHGQRQLGAGRVLPRKSPARVCARSIWSGSSASSPTTPKLGTP